MKKRQQVEVAQKHFIVTEYEQCRYWCAHCQCYHEAKLPVAVERAGLFGPNLISLTAYLKGRCHMSYKTIQCFFADAFGLKVSTGFLLKQIGKANNALKTPYEHLVDQLPNYHFFIYNTYCYKTHLIIFMIAFPAALCPDPLT